MKLESERLIIRDFKISDASFYFELFNDPDWIRHISDKNLESINETAAYLEKTQLENSTIAGLGFFTVVSKETNKAIGLSSALQRDKLEYIDIGYGFLPESRGNGYAIEATKLIIEYVREKFKQKKVLALTKPDNENSQKLLKKIGFNFIGYQAVIGDEDAVFEYDLLNKG